MRPDCGNCAYSVNGHYTSPGIWHVDCGLDPSEVRSIPRERKCEHYEFGPSKDEDECKVFYSPSALAKKREKEKTP